MMVFFLDAAKEDVVAEGVAMARPPLRDGFHLSLVAAAATSSAITSSILAVQVSADASV